MPITIITGAGDRPNRSNGAPGRATPRPQRLRLLKPKLIRMIGRRGQHHAHEVDPHVRAAFVRLQLEAQEEHDRRDHDQKPEHRAPADEGAEQPADQERRDAGGGARRAQAPTAVACCWPW